MDNFTTYDKKGYFSLDMSDFSGNSFDNAEVLNLRFTLLLVENGSGIAQINGNSAPFIAPCVFCINETEHIVIPEAADNSLRAIFLHPRIINSQLDFENCRSLPDNAPMTLQQDRELLRLFLLREQHYFGKFNLGPLSNKKFSTIYSDYHSLIIEQNQENWPCRSRSYIMWLLFLLENLYSVGEYSNDIILGTVEDKLHPILLYIYHNYDEKITVSDIEDKFYISRATLAKLFKENIGEPFMTYLNKMRISMSATMLRDTLLPVNEIMSGVGFFDSVHYFRTFKKYTGLTPSEYREKYGWLK